MYPWIISLSKHETSSHLADHAVSERASCAEPGIARSCSDALMAKPRSLKFVRMSLRSDRCRKSKARLRLCKGSRMSIA